MTSSKADKSYMFYVYVLYSKVNGDIYIGSTADVEPRVFRHNAGKVKSTKADRPWSLVEVHEYNTRSEAVRSEKFFKMHQQRELIRRRHNLPQ